MGRNTKKNSSRRNKGKTKLERKLLLKYLREYQEKVQETITTDSIADGHEQQQQQRPQHEQHHNNVQIGNVCLPILDDDILAKPFLSLPPDLSPGQRAMVHDICVDDLRLFHCGVDGETENDSNRRRERRVVVSIYSDGLHHIPTLHDIDTHCRSIERVGVFKPWIMRKDVYHQSKVKEGKRMIHRMIDQPGRCLRDDHDSIDLFEMKDANLSTVVPPTMNGNNSCLLVDTKVLMQRCINELESNAPTEIGFDIECYNRKYQQVTCLIQLATNDGRAYVIDVLGEGVWDAVGGLANTFGNKNIIKIGHGISSLDIQCLQRDFGIFVVNAFDTYEAAVTLGLKDKSLAKVCAYYQLLDSELYLSLKREYQMSDWTKRPLTEQMILYGLYDVHYLVKLRTLLIRDCCIRSEQVADSSLVQIVETNNNNMVHMLCEKDGLKKEKGVSASSDADTNEIMQSNPNDKMDCSEPTTPSTCVHAQQLRMNLMLMRVISKSQNHCLKFWKVVKPESLLESKIFLSLVAQHRKDGNEWSKYQVDLCSKLIFWREDVARKEECLPEIVCNIDFLIKVVVVRPVNEFGLRRIRYDIPQILIMYKDKRYMHAILQLVKQSRCEDCVGLNDIYPTYSNSKEHIATSKSEALKQQSPLHPCSCISSKKIKWVVWAATSVTIAAAVVCVLSSKRRDRK